MAPVTTRTIRSTDVPLGSGRMTLRASLAMGEGGEPETLILAVGFGTGRAFNRPPWGELPLRIPAEAIPRVLEAIEALGRGGTP